MRPRLLVVPLLSLLLAGGLARPAAAVAPLPPRPSNDLVTVATLPSTPGFAFQYEGRKYTTGANGTVRVPRAVAREADGLRPLTLRLSRGPGLLLFDRWYGLGRLHDHGGRTVATLKTYYPVRFAFENLEGAPVRRSDLGKVLLKSSTGYVVELPGGSEGKLLQANRVVPDNNGLQIKPVYFTVQSVGVEGNNVVNRSQTKFFPAPQRVVRVPLLFFDAMVRARDALFGFGLPGDLRMRFPNGRERQLHLGADGRVALPGLARGQYDLTVSGPGLRVSQPVSMSRRQVVDLKVFSWLDLVVVVLLGLGLGWGLLWWGRRLQRSRRLPAVQTDGGSDVAVTPAVPAHPDLSPLLVGPFLIHAGPLPPRPPSLDGPS